MSGMGGRVAIVTGASRGIGQAIARRFAAGGAAVAITARTAEEGQHRLSGSLSTTASEIRRAGGTVLSVVADLSKEADRERLVTTVEDELGPVDVLVNNAAVTYFEPVLEFPERHFALMFAVQVRAPFELAQRVLPGMRERRRGWILNISSRAAVHPAGPPYTSRFGSTVYGMCKAAIEPGADARRGVPRADARRTGRSSRSARGDGRGRLCAVHRRSGSTDRAGDVCPPAARGAGRQDSRPCQRVIRSRWMPNWSRILTTMWSIRS